ncbi:hypothetical protein JCM11641_000728 [Rhodosporidiobolus odoratus]
MAPSTGDTMPACIAARGSRSRIVPALSTFACSSSQPRRSRARHSASISPAPRSLNVSAGTTYTLRDVGVAVLSVWPTHSKFHGGRSVPFCWPDVSAAELAHLKEIAHKEDPLTGESLSDSLGRLLPRVPVERLLADLSRPNSPLPTALQAPLLVAARSAELGQHEAHASCSTSSAKPILPIPILRASNLAFNIYTLFTQKPGLWSAEPAQSAWWTPLHARLIHFSTIHHVMQNAGEDKALLEETEAWFVKVEQDLRAFLASPLLQLTPAEVEDAVGDFLQEPTNV